MKKQYKTNKLVTWVLFSVVFALLPFLVNYLLGISRGEKITLELLFGRGEILLASITLCGIALGELFEVASSPVATPPAFTKFIGLCSLLIIIISSLYYANVSFGGTDLKREIVATVSLWLFIFSVITSSCCIFITENVTTTENREN